MSDYQRQDPMERDLTEAERSPQEIEREIERTRERMGSNIDELGDRLSPDNLKQQAKEAITGKAQDMVANVGEQARETGSRLVSFITQNPLPVAAVSLGAIWLFTLRRGSEVSGDRMARFAYTGPERREPNGRPGLGRRLADRTESMRHTVSDAAARASERAGELKDRASERAEELGSAARERAREAKGGLQHAMEDNPLAVAAAAAVIGLAIGLLLPETERERHVMGPARDQLADKVESAATRVKEVAVDAGRDVKETVKEEVAQRGPEVKSTLKEAVENVGQQIKESAERVKDEAKQEVRQSRPKRGSGPA
jgi:ElaB/YqjD/DUF883 family membrane-anchored ribosome-binding protein